MLVDDSTKNYGIFVENMLETAQSVGDGDSTSRLKIYHSNLTAIFVVRLNFLKKVKNSTNDM